MTCKSITEYDLLTIVILSVAIYANTKQPPIFIITFNFTKRSDLITIFNIPIPLY